MLFPLQVSFFCVIIFFIVIFILSLQAQKLKLALLNNQLNANELLINEQQTRIISQQDLIEQQTNRHDKYVFENEQVSKQLEHRIKVLQEQFAEQNETISQIQSQQPEDKLYSRAFKLVQLGADIEEVMKECDIPRAEAEMLMAVHHKK